SRLALLAGNAGGDLVDSGVRPALGFSRTSVERTLPRSYHHCLWSDRATLVDQLGLSYQRHRWRSTYSTTGASWHRPDVEPELPVFLADRAGARRLSHDPPCRFGIR